ncbi:MAG TPA: MarR family transcriptional regulator [Polyangiaceae bacterium]|nr:MarR family transcriptional regulator [Polyangiaceae bacterium]
MARMRTPRRVRRPRERGSVQAVVDETIALFRWLAWASEHIYGEDARGATRRWILRSLQRRGAQSVPALARARAMRRQSVQPIVDALLADGLVELAENPAHKRSKLVVLTQEGAALVERMDRVDARVLGSVARDVAEQDLVAAAATLGALRRGFERLQARRA